MSELKAYTFSAIERAGLADYYLKSEADKVIADLEESHEKEVGQLLMEIVKLKTEKENLIKCCKEYEARSGSVRPMEVSKDFCEKFKEAK